MIFHSPFQNEVTFCAFHDAICHRIYGDWIRQSQPRYQLGVIKKIRNTFFAHF